MRCMLLWKVGVVNSESTGTAAAEMEQLAEKVLEVMTFVQGAGKAIASVEKKGNK